MATKPNQNLDVETIYLIKFIWSRSFLFYEKGNKMVDSSYYSDLPT